MLASPRRIADPDRRHGYALAVALVLLISTALRLYQLADPAEFMFDEVYYAKDAKAIVDGRVGTDGPLPWEAGDEVSWPHPEMGKFAIAVGILIFGDRSFGWRIPAVIAGMAMLALVYPLARRLGLPPPWALIALRSGRGRSVRHRPVAHRHARRVRGDVDGAVHLPRPQVRPGRAQTLDAGPQRAAGGMAVGTKWSGGLALVVVGVILVLVWARDYRAARRASGAEEAGGGNGAAPAVEHIRPHAEPVGARCAPSAPPPPSPPAAALVPAFVWLVSYTQYFASGHTWSQFVELQRQAVYFNTHLETEHTYASPSYTWIIDYRPVWYYFKGGHIYEGVVAIGNPFLWWLATLGLVVAAALAVLRRSTLLLPAAIIVALLYFPWFAASRTSFLYYMTPVAPFMAILVAGALLYAGGALPRRGWLAAAARRAAAALLWGRRQRRGVAVLDAPPPRRSTPGWVGVTVGVLLALALSCPVPAAQAAYRPYLAMVVAGRPIGICVAFVPIVLDLPITLDHFRHIMWFPSWI